MHPVRAMFPGRSTDCEGVTSSADADRDVERGRALVRGSPGVRPRPGLGRAPPHRGQPADNPARVWPACDEGGDGPEALVGSCRQPHRVVGPSRSSRRVCLGDRERLDLVLERASLEGVRTGRLGVGQPRSNDRSSSGRARGGPAGGRPRLGRRLEPRTDGPGVRRELSRTILTARSRRQARPQRLPRRTSRRQSRPCCPSTTSRCPSGSRSPTCAG